MHRSQVVSRIVFSLFCFFFMVTLSYALIEKEPNNTKEQANLLGYGKTITGKLQDQYDYYKVTLPAAGKVTVKLSGCPAGGQVQVGTTGFGYTGWQDSNGSTDVTLTFEAKSQSGFIWVSPKFVGSVCGYDWCASRFVPDGPYHVTKPSAKIPNSHEGTPILAAAEYTLALRQSQPIGQTGNNARITGPSGKAAESGGSAAAVDDNMKVFREDNFGYSFKLPAEFIWELLPDNDGYLLSGPKGSELNELIIVIQAVAKVHNPGSSAAKQLQEAKQQILGLPGGEIRSEDQTNVANQRAPYFLATYPARTSTQEPTTFGHLQMILDNDPNYYWISFSAPLEQFQKHQNIFSNMIATFEF
jgi:hypothetical protein